MDADNFVISADADIDILPLCVHDTIKTSPDNAQGSPVYTAMELEL